MPSPEYRILVWRHRGHDAAAVGDQHRRHARNVRHQHRARDQRRRQARCAVYRPRRAHQRRQDQHRADRRQHDQHPFAALRADPRHQDQAEAERAGDRAAGIGRVDAAHQLRRVLLGGGRGRQRQREAGAPQQRGRQDGPQAAHQVDLESEPRAGREQRVHRPVGQGIRQHEGGPSDGPHQRQLAAAEGQPRLRRAGQQRRRIRCPARSRSGIPPG